MNSLKMILLSCTAGCVLFGINSCKSTQDKAVATPFTYVVDDFADIQVLRYQIPNWDSLTLNQKAYVYELSEAAKCGRDILFDQNFKYNLPIRKVLEKIIVTYKGDTLSQDYKNFLIYAKRVFFSNGIHHHYAEDKIVPDCSMEFFKKLMEDSGQGDKAAELIPIIFDPKLYPQRKYTGEKEDLLLASAVNFYDGTVTKDEANKFYEQMSDPNDSTPVSYGLNSRLVKVNGVLKEETYKVGGKYSNSIKQIIRHLQLAKGYAENDEQKAYIDKLISYYTTGDLKLWDEYNIAWVSEHKGDVDFINGFVEDYGDPLGRKATWESTVDFIDKEASKRTKIISGNAQWFEDNSPIDPRFKKGEVKGVSAKVITVACLGGDCFPATPIGINLPNADWIRRDYGSKSVTIANITDAYNKAALEMPKSMLTEFAWDKAEIDLIKKFGPLTDDLHTDLHECLGHGSGQLLKGVPAGALREYSSALEEARADLFALYYLADPKLVELGVLPDNEAYKAEYISFIRNGLFTQFNRVELGKTNTEAHMQDRKLIAEWCYVMGKKENNPGSSNDVIEKRVRDGKTFFVITDFGKLRGLFGKLLAEVQRIKSEGDFDAGKKLINKYAINIDPLLHKEVRERYASLGLKPYKGFINPDIVPVLKGGKIIDYKVQYSNDFLKQMIDYGTKYSFEN